MERNSINVHSNTRPQLALQKWEPAGRIGDFGNFFNGLAKRPRVLRSSLILNECNFYCKVAKYCFLSKVCMLKTVPHSTVSPQVWYYKWYERLVYTNPDLLASFWKVNLSNAKNRPDFFSGLINLRWSRSILWLLNVIEDDCQFLGVCMRLLTWCKIWFTFGLLQIIFL